MEAPDIDRFHGHTWVWGVDVATDCLDFAFVHADGRYSYASSAVPSGLRGAERMATVFRQTVTFARAMAAHYKPLIVYVELPTGRFPNPALTQMSGIAQAAIYEGLGGLYNYPVWVQQVPIDVWKQQIVGKGGASKEQVMAWARERGYTSDRQDTADALAIAALAALETGCGPGPSRQERRAA